jgi:two-component system, LytTR family, sensor kinase
MHPAIFLAAWVALGGMFALQDYTMESSWGYRVHIGWETLANITYFFLWGCICQVLWWGFRGFFQQAALKSILLVVVPISLIISVLQEVIWVACFPNFPLHAHSWTYLHRLQYYLSGEFIDNLVIFWVVFGMFRGIGYYQKFRDKEYSAVRLENELTNAQLRALRMQLNPHFLFNTMNSISSLMRSDIDAADSMLEQMSSLLRMTLERRDVQLIPLHDEIEFIETYLGMQDRRYAGRVVRTLSVDPELHDALVPAMFLQPIAENAYAHGLSKLDRGGELTIEVSRHEGRVWTRVTNSGVGLSNAGNGSSAGHGVGLSNVKSRLLLHYGDDCLFSVSELDPTHVQVSIAFPLQLSPSALESVTRFGA